MDASNVYTYSVRQILRTKTCSLLILGVVLLLTDGTQASGFGDCPTYPPIKNVNLTRMLGKWYEVERSFYLMEIASGCITLKVARGENNNLDVLIYGTNRLTGNIGVPSRGVAVISKKEPSVFKYQYQSRLPPALVRILPGTGIYQILATDYDNYFILWSCSNMAFAHSDLIWVLGRTREIDVHKRAEIYSRLHDFKIDSDRLIISKNVNCPIV